MVTEDWQKINVIIACGECGYDFDPQCDPDLLGVELYFVDSLRELAEQFVEEGLYGDIPENLQFYIDYDAMARDLGMEYSETEIACQWQLKFPQKGQVKIPQFGVSVVSRIYDFILPFRVLEVGPCALAEVAE